MSASTSNSTSKVSIVVALIALISAVSVAIINAHPDLLGKVSATQIPFVKYDDPLGIISIEYPSGFQLTKRSVDYSLQYFSVEFENPSWRGEYINIGIGTQTATNMDIGTLNTNLIEYYTQLRSAQIGDEWHLISNTKRDKGFYFVLEGPPLFNEQHRYLHKIVEIENGFEINVMLTVNHDDSNIYTKQVVEHFISTFSWSSSALEKVFSQVP